LKANVVQVKEVEDVDEEEDMISTSELDVELPFFFLEVWQVLYGER
jgi:hypothetical protein